MRVLVLGGSVFLGRAVVAEALALGAEVTVFNRGRSGSPPPDGVEQLVGDRTVAADLDALRGRDFDLVVDTCGYVPVDVAASARALEAGAAFYAFVSSINAYPTFPASPSYDVDGVHDGDPDATRDDVPDSLDAAASYGWLKVGCERAVERVFGPRRCSILRGGLIAGPYDAAVARLPWWIARVARGGRVLVPGEPGDPIALIDSRDLAQFALSAVPGAFETAGPAGRDTRADLMAACAAATGTDPELVWVDSDWLAAQGVAAWSEVPLWLPPSTAPATFVPHVAAAVDAGLRWRPLADTVADTWSWLRGVPGWQQPDATPGLAPQREADLLAAWDAR